MSVCVSEIIVSRMRSTSERTDERGRESILCCPLFCEGQKRGRSTPINTAEHYMVVGGGSSVNITFIILTDKYLH